MDVKANWARTRNKYGDHATDLRVSASVSSLPQSVDPFGPPLLTFDDRQAHRPASKPPMVPTAPNRKLAIQQPPPLTTVVQEITPSPSTMMKDSLMLSDEEEEDEDDTDSEITRIINEENIHQANAKPAAPTQTKPTAEPLLNKSDSDEDDFIRMLKGK